MTLSSVDARQYLSSLRFRSLVDFRRRKYAQGDVDVVRYADDIDLGFQHGTDADCFQESFGERLGKFGLPAHQWEEQKWLIHGASYDDRKLMRKKL